MSMFDDDDFDVSGFAPAPAAPADPAVIRELAERRGFVSREPPAPPEPRQVRRHRTGRNAHLNVRTTPDFKARFEALADAKGLSLAETFEAAVVALEASRDP